MANCVRKFGITMGFLDGRDFGFDGFLPGD